MKRILSMLILILIAISAAGASSQVTVVVRPESEVTAGSCTLGDIATMQCSKRELGEELRNVPVCPSPLPGKTRTLSKDQIVIAIRRAGINDRTVEMLCPPQITVTRASSKVSGQALFEAVREFALGNNSYPGIVSVEPVRLPTDQMAPVGKLGLRVKSGTREVRKGQSSLPVEIMVDGQVYRTIHVPVLVKVFARAPVATQAIPRSTEISAANVALRECDITALPNDVLLEAPLPGWIASVPIPEGSIIRRQWIVEPPAIHSGDAVLVIVQNGAVRVTSKGIAAQDGRPGQKIKVRLTGDVREIRGTVAEPGIVMISIPEIIGSRRD